MIVYIHGFGSSGLGEKARILRKHYGDRMVAPSLSFVPDLAMDTLDQIVRHLLPMEPVRLIGSSLGGYYALYLAEKYELKSVLINPSLEPYETLSSMTGTLKNYHDGAAFEWTKKHLEMLEKYRVHKPAHPDRILLLLQTGDEVLDYHVAMNRLKAAEIILQQGGSHAFEGFEKLLPRIAEFLEEPLEQEERKEGAIQSILKMLDLLP